jgi:hypothetical protein
MGLCFSHARASGALDRLGSGDDPVTRFSAADRLWVYLHRSRSTAGALTLQTLTPEQHLLAESCLSRCAYVPNVPQPVSVPVYANAGRDDDHGAGGDVDDDNDDEMQE